MCNNNTCLGRSHSHPLVWWWPKAAARLWESWTEPWPWEDEGVVSPRMTHCWAHLGIFVLVVCWDAGRVVEGQCRLLLLSLTDGGMACQYAHLSLQNERERGGGEMNVWLSLVQFGLWTHASVHLLYTCAETDVCLSNTPKTMFITSNNSHNSL